MLWTEEFPVGDIFWVRGTLNWRTGSVSTLIRCRRTTSSLVESPLLPGPAVGRTSEKIADHVTGKMPNATVTGVKLTRYCMHFDPSATLSELELRRDHSLQRFMTLSRKPDSSVASDDHVREQSRTSWGRDDKLHGLFISHNRRVILLRECLKLFGYILHRRCFTSIRLMPCQKDSGGTWHPFHPETCRLRSIYVCRGNECPDAERDCRDSISGEDLVRRGLGSLSRMVSLF